MLHVIGSKQTLETDFATGKQEFADHKMNDSGSSFGDIFKQIVNLPEPKPEIVSFVFLGMPSVDLTSAMDKITDAHDFMEGFMTGSGFYA